jgi:hydrogenase maturation protease
MNPPAILIACIGNIFQGDDAFGCEVARALSTRHLPPDVRVIDYGIRGLDLSWALMDGPELTILVDAVPGDAEPGSLYVIEPDTSDLDEGEATLDGHSMDPLQVLRSVKAMGGELGRVVIVGCQPGDLGGEEGRMGLTEPVAAAIQSAVEMIESLVSRELQEA